MAEQSKVQDEIVDRVLHAYEHGQLETSAGDKVTNRRQALAIAPSKAGGPNRPVARTRDAGPARAELYEQAKRRNVAGRSTMAKAELAAAVTP